MEVSKGREGEKYLRIVMLHSLQQDLMLLGVIMDRYAVCLPQAGMRDWCIPSNFIPSIHHHNTPV